MNLKVVGSALLLWARTMFGDVALSKRERTMRFFEESCELSQAGDLTEEEAVAILRRTWSRPKDTIHKEAGGVMVTFLAFCSVHNIDPEDALHDELRRILSKPNEHWRAKHDAKVDAGTTTGYSGEARPDLYCHCTHLLEAKGPCPKCGKPLYPMKSEVDTTIKASS